jgi:hypothetical protein
MNPSEHEIAYHEAGHAAADLIFGHLPDQVTIVKKGHNLGTAPNFGGDNMSDEGARSLIIAYYAGAEAESRVCNDLEHIKAGACVDDELAEDLLPLAGRTEQQMRDETAKFISEHWPLVERIAVELLTYGTLTFEELELLLNIYRKEETEQDLIEFRIMAEQQGRFNVHGRRKGEGGAVKEQSKETINLQEIIEGIARHNANRHLALYLKTGDGLLIWRAYQEFRNLGLAVPEEILKKLDQFAEGLSKASGAKGIAEAMEMAVSRGGSAGFKRTTATEAQRNVVEYVRDAREAREYAKNKKSMETIYKEAAERFKTTPNRVKTLYSKWRKDKTKPGQKVDMTSKPWK